MDEYIQQNKKICIVEDDDNIREIYATELRSKGFTVIEAENGEEGLDLIKQNNPDLIMLDLKMPVMNGLEVLEKLRKDSQISKIPVIVLTNVDDQDSINEVGKYETRFYVVKSLTTPQKILGMIREVLH
jgi:CheY-like chemotaxis protein